MGFAIDLCESESPDTISTTPYILAAILEDSFNIVICQQLLGTTIQICISSYQILSSLAVLEGIGILTFAIYVFVLSSTIFTYCYIGECLIEESTNLCDALYHCDWYELSTIDVKSIYICMIRARKPLQLTCAKFCVVSLRTFTDTLIEYFRQFKNFEV
ncbi:odorant receptor 13a-like [Vespula maculifrons]|uniref:Odorant receptor 13a-like n=1 Tax=Vespula maculifrons TaxID=7453 RepID=A0ABD2BQX3_VESMC